VEQDEATARLAGAWDDSTAAVDTRLEEMLSSATGSLNWRDVTPDDAPQRWKALRDWVDWFRAEFAYEQRVVPPCWYEHRALVNLLTALRDHWTHAYDPMNSAAGASEWHQVLVVLEPRLREWVSRTGCGLTHRPDVLLDLPDDAERWAQHVARDVAARREEQQRKGSHD
jgi:hypothetical protein